MAFRRRDTDAQLVDQALSGQLAAFNALVARHVRVVYAVTQAWTPSATEVEDIAQEAFLAAYERLPSLRNPARFKAWLVQIARNIAVTRCRQRVREDGAMERFGRESDSRVSTVADEVELKETHGLIRQEIDRLDDRMREVVMLRYFAGKKSREIAQLLETSPAAVRKRLQRAREVLGNRLLVLRGQGEQEEGRAWEARVSCIAGAIASANVSWPDAPLSNVENLSKPTEPAPGGASEGTSMFTGSTVLKAGIVAVVSALAVLSGGTYLGTMGQDAAIGNMPSPSKPVEVAQAELDAELPEPDEAESAEDPDTLRVGNKILSSLLAVIEASPPELPDQLTGPCVVTGWVDRPGATIVMVRTGGSGAPLGPDLAINKTAEADEYGAFTFPGLPTGKFIVMAYTEDGFAVAACRTYPDPEVFVELRILPTSPLSGRVVDESGLPVSGAVLYAHTYSRMLGELGLWVTTAAAVVAESDGAFYTPFAFPGKWRFWVKADGYATTLSSWFETGVEGNEIVLPRGAALVGRAVNVATNEPLPNVPILLTRGAVYRDRQEAATGTDGRFQFQGLNAETYELTIGRCAWVNAGAPVEVTVANGQQIVEATVLTEMGSALGGRVYDADTGEGLAGTRITVEIGGEDHSTFWYEHPVVQTDANGFYYCEGVRPGTCRLFLKRIEGYPDGPTHRMTIELGRGEVKAEVDFPVQKGVPIRGQVFDLWGDPTALATVTARSDKGSSKVVSKPDGSFFCAVPKGSTEVTLKAQKPCMLMRPMSPLPLPSDGLASVVLKLDATGSVAGRVIDVEGNPVMGVAVSARNRTHSRYGSHFNHVDPEGSFVVPTLLPGPTVLVAQPDGSDLRGATTPVEVMVEVGKTRDGVVLVFEHEEPDDEAADTPTP
ncbi:MAG: sigma-70 family RNA polymerase sigma factor [bacterium]|nr:sigma-70 family RNA polymerase sigma factor [bacterium]